VISQLQNLSHYPDLAAAGRRMPDEGRLHSKPENLGRHTLCAKCMARLLPSMIAWQFLKIPLKRDAGITTASQAMAVYVRHPASSVWQSAGYSG